MASTHAELEPVLAGVLLDLVELCISTVRHMADYPVGASSYNMLLTLGHMYVFPRRHERGRRVKAVAEG